MKDVLENELMEALAEIQASLTDVDADYRITTPMGAPCPDCSYRCNGDCSGKRVSEDFFDNENIDSVNPVKLQTAA